MRPRLRHLSGIDIGTSLESLVQIIKRRKHAIDLESIASVDICGSCWGMLLPYSYEMDELVKHITYVTYSVSVFCFASKYVEGLFVLMSNV